MYSAAQLRAGRALLGLTLAQVAERARLPVPAVKQVETKDAFVQPGSDYAAVRRALEAAGVEFIDGHAPGVRLRPKPDEGLRPEQLTSENDG